MDLGLAHKRALVFGASSGIGRAVAAALAQEGARVGIVSRHPDRLARAAREIDAAVCVTADLTQPGAAARATQEGSEKLGGIDILVCNSGGPPKGGLAAITDAQWAESFQSLWMAVVESVRIAAPAMQEKGFGRILLITSTSAREALPSMTVSNSLRAGLLGLVKTLSNDLAAFGITVNALLPGYIDTDRLRDLGVKPEAVIPAIPAGRIGRPEELAAVATFLASQLASYVSGQGLAVDGGRLRGI